MEFKKYKTFQKIPFKEDEENNDNDMNYKNVNIVLNSLNKIDFKELRNVNFSY